MDKQYWTSTEITKLYRLATRGKSRQGLLSAEERGDIPKAERIARGTVQVRQWRLDQLPEIGTTLGFLSKPSSQKIICTYTPKGGVLKTTTTWNIARTLALNGIKVLIIGLDMQFNITDVAFPPNQPEELEDYRPDHEFGLYHLLYEQMPVSDVIKKTTLPTLDVLPEIVELSLLGKKIGMEVRSEYVFKEKLIPQLADYDVILFDNGPGWNSLIENSLAAANTVLSPIGCDFLSYRAAAKNLETIIEFGNAAQLSWDNFFIVPTLLEKNKLSQQIYGSYLNDYGAHVVPIPIRRAIKGQETLLLGRSPIEHDPISALAQDYFELIQYIWTHILDSEKEKIKAEVVKG